MLVNEYQVGLIIYMTVVCVKIFVLLYTVKIGIFVRLQSYIVITRVVNFGLGCTHPYL